MLPGEEVKDFNNAIHGAGTIDKTANSSDQHGENQTLYVGNLKPGIESQKLYDFFTDQKFSVVNAKIRVAKNDMSKVFGVVKFCSDAEAQKALDLLNNAEFEGCKIIMMWYNKNMLSKDKEQANIFVKDIHPSVEQKDLHDRFSIFGTVLSVKIETFMNGSSKGFGYVQFEDAEDAKKAIESMNGQEWHGKKITVCPFKKQGEREDKKTFKNNLYVKNFPSSYEEKELRELFGKHGEITSILVKPHEDSKKQAFI